MSRFVSFQKKICSQWNSILINISLFLFFCSEDMLVFIYHPFYQAEEEFLECIPAAFHVLENLHGEDFPIPPPRGTVDPGPQVGKCVWHVAYKVICAGEEVDILESINRLPKHYRLGFMSLYSEGKDGTPYDNTSPRDEIIFFKNICEHIREHMKVRVLP